MVYPLFMVKLSRGKYIGFLLKFPIERFKVQDSLSLWVYFLAIIADMMSEGERDVYCL